MIFSRWFSKKAIPATELEITEMRDLCVKVAENLRAAGYTTDALSLTPRPYPKDFLHRKEALTLFNELIAGPDCKNHKDLMWRYFSKMRFVPASDVLDRIEDDDILEVYDMNGDQIFRNLNYFDVVSFSVEDLVSMNWKRDFKRSAKVTIQLVELVFRFATGYFTRTMDCAKVPVHIVEETIARRHKIELHLKYISPLKQNGKCVAILVGSRARILEPAQ